MKKTIVMGLLGLAMVFSICKVSWGGINCPNNASTCYYKLKYSRLVDISWLPEGFREAFDAYHWDYSIAKIENGVCTEQESSGFYSVNTLGELFLIWSVTPLWNESDGEVRSSTLTGSTEDSKIAITEADYEARKIYQASLIDVLFEDCYKVTGDNCEDYANNMYTDGEHGLE